MPDRGSFFDVIDDDEAIDCPECNGEGEDDDEECELCEGFSWIWKGDLT